MRNYLLTYLERRTRTMDVAAGAARQQRPPCEVPLWRCRNALQFLPIFCMDRRGDYRYSQGVAEIPEQTSGEHNWLEG